MLYTTKTRGLLAALSCFISVPAFAQDERPPWVEWATRIGSFGVDGAFGIGADAEGYVYVGGRTDSAGLLVNAGYGDLPDFAGGDDGVVFKLAPDGSEILAAASFGGPGFEAIYGLEMTADGSVIVIGQASPGFESPIEACRIGPGGGVEDCFVARLDDELEVVSLVVFGGTGIDSAVDMDVSADGIVSVLGATNSRNLPTTPGALHEEFLGGESDLFVARFRLDADLGCDERAVYVTYVGSPGSEDNPEFSIDCGVHATDDGVVTVAGKTRSLNAFPRLCDSPPCSSPGGGLDVFVQRIRCDASLPRSEQDLYSAVVGGNKEDDPKWVGVTDEGIVQVVGWSFSDQFPTTDGSPFGGVNDVFILEIDPDPALPENQQLLVSTRFGGSGYDATGEATSRPDGTIFVGGQSEEFPVSCGALAGFVRGQARASLAEWRRDDENPGTGLIGLSTALTLGGCATTCDRVYKLAFAPDGALLVAGVVVGSFPFNPGDVAQPVPGGGEDMLIMRLDVRTPRAEFSIEPRERVTPVEVCFDGANSVSPEGTRIASWEWTLDDQALLGNPSVCAEIRSPGIHEATLQVVNDVGHCHVRSRTFVVSCPPGDTEPWTATDVGDVQFGGGSDARIDGDSTCIDLCAAGRTWSGESDAFHFVHQTTAGSITLAATVEAFESDRTNAGGGVMLRESTDKSSRFAAVVVHRASGPRVRLVYRDKGTVQRVTGPAITLPVRLSVERRGNEFVGWVDGQTPVAFEPVRIEGFALQYKAGVAATAALGPGGPMGDGPVAMKVCEIELKPSGEAFLRGDCNDDGTVDISDATCILNWLFAGGEDPGCISATNTNGDEATNITDATYLLNHLFSGGPAPAAPFPDCGPGTLPADQTLGCANPPACQ